MSALRIVAALSLAITLFCLPGCFTKSMIIVPAIPATVIAADNIGAFTVTDHSTKRSKEVSRTGLYLSSEFGRNPGWRTVTYDLDNSFIRRRVEYGSGSAYGAEIGVRTEVISAETKTLIGSAVIISAGYYAAEYNAKVDNVKDKVEERKIVLRLGYALGRSLAGARPFIRSGLGFVRQEFRVSTFNNMSSTHNIGAACFDSAVGLNIDLSKNHNNGILLSLGCEYEKIAANGLDALYGKNDGETARYKPFFSLAINF